jgi:hypothetical protein
MLRDWRETSRIAPARHIVSHQVSESPAFVSYRLHFRLCAQDPTAVFMQSKWTLPSQIQASSMASFELCANGTFHQEAASLNLQYGLIISAVKPVARLCLQQI